MAYKREKNKQKTRDRNPCLNCKQDFTVYLRSHAKFCSTSCRVSHWQKKQREKLKTASGVSNG